MDQSGRNNSQKRPPSRQPEDYSKRRFVGGGGGGGGTSNSSGDKMSSTPLYPWSAMKITAIDESGRRRHAIAWDWNATPSFLYRDRRIIADIKSRFPEYDEASWSCYWVDEEGDEIVLTRETDFLYYSTKMKNLEQILHIFIRKDK